ncbi:hypothetical protein ACS126_03355 [Sphingobacterium lactis]|uniref:hypothetical protein n=1 Tax=Sphingobacterium TaxID=28453 RepID=UPI0021A86539|nr:hypothetical protein [Sphingobacterium hotanense]MCT1525810.1 hypothetical protein [Sphingobacterium hotanense]
MQTKDLNEAINIIEDYLVLPYDGVAEAIARITSDLTSNEQQELLTLWIDKHKGEVEYVNSCFSLTDSPYTHLIFLVS